jgi:type I restriction enzyme S subunit
MMRLQLSQLINSLFIAIYLRSFWGDQLTINAKWEVNQASINQKDVSNTFIPIPPLAEQRVISEKVESCLSLSYQMDKSTDNDLKRADRFRQSILKHAFEGRLVPQDPSDEPASMLLERIRAEKALKMPGLRQEEQHNYHQWRRQG